MITTILTERTSLNLIHKTIYYSNSVLPLSNKDYPHPFPPCCPLFLFYLLSLAKFHPLSFWRIFLHDNAGFVRCMVDQLGAGFQTKSLEVIRLLTAQNRFLEKGVVFQLAVIL